MYSYDSFDKNFVAERAAQFRDQVKRRIAGELSEEEFRPLRLRNGLYLQLHAYMLRVSIPYGTLSTRQLRQLGHIARKFDRGWGHFTTRQNIQYNWIKLEDAPDALAALAEVEMHALQTSGNCVRNITSDQYAGAAADEIEDPRPWCEVIRQWSSLHPEFTFLPRKFKFAVTASPHDRAAIKVHDIGLRMHRNAAGEVGFEVIVGGGLGRTPMIGKTIRDFVSQEHLLTYLEAVLRVYNLWGRRDNQFKARIKIQVHETGIAKMKEMVEAEFRAMMSGPLTTPLEDVARIAAQFAPPPFDKDAPVFTPELDALRLGDAEFGRWLKANIAAHKQPGYAIVTLSLKPEGEPPGDMTADQMDKVADLADRYSFGDVRVTHTQNLVFPHVRRADLPAVWRELKELNLATANVGLVTDIIACPGLDYCSLANARSIPVATRLTQRFNDLKRVHDIGELKIKISGCINACGHHHIGHIGILGVDKNGTEFYQITIGGTEDQNAAIGTIVGPAVPYEDVVDAVESIVETYISLRREGEKFLDTYRRVGIAPFKERLYAAA